MNATTTQERPWAQVICSITAQVAGSLTSLADRMDDEPDYVEAEATAREAWHALQVAQHALVRSGGEPPADVCIEQLQELIDQAREGIEMSVDGQLGRLV